MQVVKLIDAPVSIGVSGFLTAAGAYDAGTDYAVGDVVSYEGSSYVMYVDAAAGTAPTDTTKWQILINASDYLASLGAVVITNATTDNTISVDQNGNVGTDVSTDGAVHIENTGNSGIGLGVYTNIGATAEAPLVSIHADNAVFDQTVVYIKNDGVDMGVEILNAGVLASNKRALKVWSDTAQTTGDLVAFELGSGSSTRHSLFVSNAGEGAAIRINAAKGSHIQFIGDTPNSTPTDGDMWFDGTNFKVCVGSTVSTLDMTAV